MYLCLFEDPHVAHLLPLVHTRGVYDLRLGIRTLLERHRDDWGPSSTFLHARNAVAEVVAQENDLLVNRIPEGLDVLFLNGRVTRLSETLRTRLQDAIRLREEGRVFVQDDAVVAAWVPGASMAQITGDALTRQSFAGLPEEACSGTDLIERLWNLIGGLRTALVDDYHALAGRYKIYEHPGATIQEGARLIGEEIYLAPGVTIRPEAILNATDGPIYLGRNVTVMEGAIVRGPVFAGAGSRINVGANIEGCAFGPGCKVGGEVHSSVLHSYTSKAHAGFLGHAYIGRWCNLGADTNNSNLRNDYGHVPLYDTPAQAFQRSDQQFLGLFMADHAKCSINTMFNTGTVVGVSCNLFGSGFHPRYIPSFMWGGPDARYTTYRLPKALRVAEIVMPRRNHTLTDADRALLKAVYDATEAEREAGPRK